MTITFGHLDCHCQVTVSDMRTIPDDKSGAKLVEFIVRDGPQALSQNSNRFLYSTQGLQALWNGLATNGQVLLWSSSNQHIF